MGTNCSPTALVGLVQPGLKSLFFCSCGAAATQPAVREYFLLQCGHGLNSQSQDSAFFSFEQSYRKAVWRLGQVPSFPPVGAPLPVLWKTSPQTWAAGRCGADGLCGSGSGGLFSQGWHLLLVLMQQWRKRCVKLFLFSFVPIREWIPPF